MQAECQHTPRHDAATFRERSPKDARFEAGIAWRRQRTTTALHSLLALRHWLLGLCFRHDDVDVATGPAWQAKLAENRPPKFASGFQRQN